MGVREKKIGSGFRRMSLIALAVIVLINLIYALDFLFHLGWGYSLDDLKIAVGILVFAVILRFIGLRVIGFFDESH